MRIESNRTLFFCEGVFTGAIRVDTPYLENRIEAKFSNRFDLRIESNQIESNRVDPSPVTIAPSLGCISKDSTCGASDKEP